MSSCAECANMAIYVWGKIGLCRLRTLKLETSSFSQWFADRLLFGLPSWLPPLSPPRRDNGVSRSSLEQGQKRVQ